MSSYTMKASLLSYYRFKRGYICADECRCSNGEIADLLVDTGKSVIDIEIKISKSDLINGEAKKYKHKQYTNPIGNKRKPNKFYLCVPEKLREVAEEWVKATNPKYGIIIFNPPTKYRFGCDFEYNLNFIKNAKSFNKEYSGEYYKEQIARRLSSARANTLQKDIIKADFNKSNEAK